MSHCPPKTRTVHWKVKDGYKRLLKYTHHVRISLEFLTDLLIRRLRPRSGPPTQDTWPDPTRSHLSFRQTHAVVSPLSVHTRRHSPVDTVKRVHTISDCKELPLPHGKSDVTSETPNWRSLRTSEGVSIVLITDIYYDPCTSLNLLINQT